MTISFDSLHEGDEITALQAVPDLGRVIRFCALSWNFPSLFYDVDAARAQGMPGTVVPGPVKLGLICRAIEEWLGDAGYVRHVRAAHRRPDITGRPITIEGRIARIYEEGGHRRADLELAVLNQDHEVSVRGFATVEFTR